MTEKTAHFVQQNEVLNPDNPHKKHVYSVDRFVDADSVTWFGYVLADTHQEALGVAYIMAADKCLEVSYGFKISNYFYPLSDNNWDYETRMVHVENCNKVNVLPFDFTYEELVKAELSVKMLQEETHPYEEEACERCNTLVPAGELANNYHWCDQCRSENQDEYAGEDLPEVDEEDHEAA